MDLNILLQRSSSRNDILSCIDTITKFLDDAIILMDNNVVFKKIADDCKHELKGNSCYQTIADDKFDCGCFEFDIYLGYIKHKAECVMVYMRDIRKLTNNQFLYTIYNFVEEQVIHLQQVILQISPDLALDDIEENKHTN